MAGLLGVLWALVPSLTVLAEPSLPAAVLALVLAAVWTGGRHRAAPLGRLALPPTDPSYDVGAVVRGRATDPVHHPVRPRAPGIV